MLRLIFKKFSYFIFFVLCFSCQEKTPVSNDTKQSKKSITDTDSSCEEEKLELNLTGDIPCASEQDLSLGSKVSLEKIIGSDNKIYLNINMPNRSPDITIIQAEICDSDGDCVKKTLEMPTSEIFISEPGVKNIKLKYCVRDCSSVSENMETLDGYVCKEDNQEYIFYQDENSKEVTDLIKRRDHIKNQIITNINTVWPYIKDFVDLYKKGQCSSCDKELATILSHNVLLGPEGFFYLLTDSSYDDEVNQYFSIESDSLNLAEDNYSCSSENIEELSSSSVEKISAPSIRTTNNTYSSEVSGPSIRSTLSSSISNDSNDSNSLSSNDPNFSSSESSSESSSLSNDHLFEDNENKDNKDNEKNIGLGFGFFAVGAAIVGYLGIRTYNDWKYNRLSDELWDILMKPAVNLSGGDGSLKSRMTQFNKYMEGDKFKKLPQAEQDAFKKWSGNYETYLEEKNKLNNMDGSSRFSKETQVFENLEKTYMDPDNPGKSARTAIKNYDADIRTNSKRYKRAFSTTSVFFKFAGFAIGVAALVGGISTLFMDLTDSEDNDIKIQKDLMEAIDVFNKQNTYEAIKEYKEIRDRLNNI